MWWDFCGKQISRRLLFIVKSVLFTEEKMVREDAVLQLCRNYRIKDGWTNIHDEKKSGVSDGLGITMPEKLWKPMLSFNLTKIPTNCVKWEIEKILYTQIFYNIFDPDMENMSLQLVKSLSLPPLSWNKQSVLHCFSIV